MISIEQAILNLAVAAAAPPAAARTAQPRLDGAPFL
jgi:hypothetical protein